MADINLNFNEKDLVRAAKELQKAAKSIQTAFKKAGGPIQKDIEDLKRAATGTRKLVTEKKKLTAIEKEQLRLENREATLKARITLATGKQAQSVKKLEKELRNLNTQMRTGGKNTASWGKALGSFQFKFNALGNVAANVTSVISRKLNQAIRESARIVVDFEKAMADVRAITNATNKDFLALAKSAKTLGGITKFTATEVAGLQKEYAKLGFSTKQILNATAATLDLAAATDTELARAAGVVGVTLKQFGLEATETQRVVGVMAKSFTTSALDMEKFAEAMKFVGPAAKASGLSIEETTARLAQLADAGIAGTLGGTALRRIFTLMAIGGHEAAARIKELSLAEIGLAEASEEVQQRAATALLVLADGVDTVDDFTESLENAGGAAQRMADIQLDTLKGKTDLVKSAWEKMILTFIETENGLEGLKFAFDNIILVLDALAIKAEGGFKFVDALNIAKVIKEADEWGKKMQRNEEHLDMMVDGFKNIGGWMQELGRDLWAQMFPKDSAEEVIEEFEDITELVKNLRDELRFKEDDDEARGPFKFLLDKDQQNEAQSNLDNISANINDSLDEQVAKEQEAAKKKLQLEDEKQKKVQAGFDLAARGVDAFSDIFEAAKQRELSAAGDNAQKREEIEKRYRRKQQVLAIASAIIDGAEAFQKAQKAAVPPANIPFMVASAAITAAQVGIIASQKFAKGGIDIEGASHARGGILAEIEGGESVINKRSTSKYKGLLDAINQDDQMRIQDALGRDKKISITNGGNADIRRMRELMERQIVYGEDNEYYYKEVGNTIIQTRKN